MTKALYNLKSLPGGALYEITKFSPDLEVESSYAVGKTVCDCPQGHKPVCRHRRMLPFFLEAEAVDSDIFFNFDNHSWHRPMIDDNYLLHDDFMKRREALKKQMKQPQGIQVIPKATSDVAPMEPTTDAVGSPATEGAEVGPPVAPAIALTSVGAEPSVAPLKRRKLV